MKPGELVNEIQSASAQFNLSNSSVAFYLKYWAHENMQTDTHKCDGLMWNYVSVILIFVGMNVEIKLPTN